MKFWQINLVDSADNFFIHQTFGEALHVRKIRVFATLQVAQ
jgi:hypothetical protein